MLVLCYPKCTTCQKALAWLDAHGLSYETVSYTHLTLPTIA